MFQHHYDDRASGYLVSSCSPNWRRTKISLDFLPTRFSKHCSQSNYLPFTGIVSDEYIHIKQWLKQYFSCVYYMFYNNVLLYTDKKLKHTAEVVGCQRYFFHVPANNGCVRRSKQLGDQLRYLGSKVLSSTEWTKMVLRLSVGSTEWRQHYGNPGSGNNRILLQTLLVLTRVYCTKQITKAVVFR